MRSNSSRSSGWCRADGGNPFFIEEIVQALFDEGVLLRNGVVKVTRSLSQLRLPSTVQGSSLRVSTGCRSSTSNCCKRLR